ncbi:MAG TPA: Uma2 family endonuclease [Pirellulales bacterium]|jgi:Uma2 family endonuclease|nr:Uma2 family endonuclease [Pirellulales bacterium]
MSTLEQAPPASNTIPPPTPLAPHRFSVEQYHRMIEAGILTTSDRVQLLEGVILEMTPVGIPHMYAVRGMMRAILRLLPNGWDVAVQQPVRLVASEPEPDLSVVRGSYLDYHDHHPGPGEIGLVIEVAESALGLDRGAKARVYAAAGVPEYWIVNLIDRQVEIHRDPRTGESGEPAYQTGEIVPTTGVLKLVLDGRLLGEISVASILP